MPATTLVERSAEAAGRTRRQRIVHFIRRDFIRAAPPNSALGVRCESIRGRVAGAAGPDARRRAAGDVEHIVEASQRRRWPRAARNPKGAGVSRAIAALLLLDGPHRDRLRRRALRTTV